jgi:hypothetical protein
MSGVLEINNRALPISAVLSLAVSLVALPPVSSTRSSPPLNALNAAAVRLDP